MKFALASTTLFIVGYYFGGGELDVLDFLQRLALENPLEDAVFDGVMYLDDARVMDFYATIRMDFWLGPYSLLLGFVCALLLRGRFDFVAVFLLLGLVARHWVPSLFELVPRVPRAEMFSLVIDFLEPRFPWDIALFPAYFLGVAVGRLVKLRRIPRCRISSAGVLTVLFALLLTAIHYGLTSMLPFAIGGIMLFLAIGLLIQTNSTVKDSPNQPLHPSGEPSS
jgi:hypothetical protein